MTRPTLARTPRPLRGASPAHVRTSSVPSLWCASLRVGQVCGLVTFALLAASAVQAQDVAWKIDKAHSKVGFVARHLAFAKVSGKFGAFDAKITANAKTGKLSSVEATVQAASVDTDNDKRDQHLRKDDFFAADKHPTLKLKTKSIKWNGNRFTALTALTIRGVTRDVTFTGELLGARKVDFGRGSHMRAAYEATAKINRKEFGLKFNGLAEGISIVGDEVEIDLQIEASH